MSIEISIFLASILVSLTGSCLAVGYAAAFWRTKASLLGARPDGIGVLYKVAVCLSVTVSILLMTPLGALAILPGMIVGGTAALLNVVHMDREDRQNFLIHNRGRYSDPREIEHEGQTFLS